MSKNLAIFSAVIIAIILSVTAIVYYTKSQEDVSSNQPQTEETTQNETSADTDSVEEDQEIDETSTVSVEMNHLSFTPNLITAKTGTTVEVKLTNIDEVHDFVIDELNVNSGLMAAGSEKTIEFTIPENLAPGDYEFYCSVGSHRLLGMKGILRVTN